MYAASLQSNKDLVKAIHAAPLTNGIVYSHHSLTQEANKSAGKRHKMLAYLLQKRMSMPASIICHISSLWRCTTPASPAVNATIPLLQAACFAALKRLGNTFGTSHMYPSMMSILDAAIACWEACDSCRSCSSPRYDRNVRFASGVVKTMAVPAPFKGF